MRLENLLPNTNGKNETEIEYVNKIKTILKQLEGLNIVMAKELLDMCKDYLDRVDIEWD